MNQEQRIVELEGQIAELKEQLRVKTKLLEKVSEAFKLPPILWKAEPKSVAMPCCDDPELAAAGLPMGATENLPVELQPQGIVILEWICAKLKSDTKQIIPCPTCRTNLKIYKRPFSRGMASGLLLLYKLWIQSGQPEWIDIGKSSIGRALSQRLHHAEIDKWEWWGVVRKKEERSDARGRKGGLYQITEFGMLVIFHNAPLNAHCYDILNRLIVRSNSMTTFTEALGVPFDLATINTIDLKEFIRLLDQSMAAGKSRKPRKQKERLRAA